MTLYDLVDANVLGHTHVNILRYVSGEWRLMLTDSDYLDLYQVVSILPCNETSIDLRVVPLYLDDFIDDNAYAEDLYWFCVDRHENEYLKSNMSMAEWVKNNCPLAFARYLIDLGYSLDDYVNTECIP